jgi:predicted MPP superfamily phosphohydrolase
VLFTGDLVNSTTNEAIKFRESLRAIKAKERIYAVLGNHDYGDYVNWPDARSKQQNMEMLYDFYEGLGWKLLNNENDLLKRGEDEIAIVGVENWSKNKRFPAHGDVDKALDGTENTPVKILLSHDPTHWEHVVSKQRPDVDLTLSGHTHGFQFGVEFKGFKWSLAQYMYKYWAGLYNIPQNGKNQYLYVNRGLGMIGYPGRVGILPEITFIELDNA